MLPFIKSAGATSCINLEQKSISEFFPLLDTMTVSVILYFWSEMMCLITSKNVIIFNQHKGLQPYTWNNSLCFQWDRLQHITMWVLMFVPFNPVVHKFSTNVANRWVSWRKFHTWNPQTFGVTNNLPTWPGDWISCDPALILFMLSYVRLYINTILPGHEYSAVKIIRQLTTDHKMTAHWGDTVFMSIQHRK